MLDQEYMKVALKEAHKAYLADEVPVGAVIVLNGEIIAKAHNLRETKQSTLSHAEIEVIKIANNELKSWRLEDCTLYVTLEPCMMCAGAIQQARVGKVVYATNDDKNGFMDQLLNETGLNHQPKVVKDVLADESKALIKTYFIDKRNEKIRIKEVSDEDLKMYYKLREEVFVQEQNVSIEEEYDEYDKKDNENVKHIIAMKNKDVIGTMRLVYQRKESVLKVGRLAIKKNCRKKGIGKKMLDYADIQARNNGISSIELGAQLSARGFYESNLYIATGSVFLDAGIEHITMIKTIKKQAH